MYSLFVPLYPCRQEAALCILPGATTGTGQSNDILRKIISYVNEHYTEKLSLEEVSDVMQESGFTNQTIFNHLFKEIYGMTPRQARNSYAENTYS